MLEPPPETPRAGSGVLEDAVPQRRGRRGHGQGADLRGLDPIRLVLGPARRAVVEVGADGLGLGRAEGAAPVLLESIHDVLGVRHPGHPVR